MTSTSKLILLKTLRQPLLSVNKLPRAGLHTNASENVMRKEFLQLWDGYSEISLFRGLANWPVPAGKSPANLASHLAVREHF